MTNTNVTTSIQEGKSIPEFSGLATNNITFNLSDYKDKNILLYFYPKDNTSGCTTEGLYFSEHIETFNQKNVVVFGVSRDSVKVHEGFKAKQSFAFELISDKDETICNLFDVIKEKKMYGKTHMGIERSTFLIGKEGILIKQWRKVKVSAHLQEVLDEIEKL